MCILLETNRLVKGICIQDFLSPLKKKVPCYKNYNIKM